MTAHSRGLVQARQKKWRSFYGPKPQSVERGEINTTDTHIYDRSLYCPGTGTSIKKWRY